MRLKAKTGVALSALGAETLVKRSLLSGGAWALGGRVASALAVLAANALLARLLSPQGLGSFFLAFSLVALGARLGSLGLNQAVVRFVAESAGLRQHERTRRVVRVVLGIGTLGASAIGLGYLLFGRVLGGELFRAPALTAVTGLVAVWMAVSTLQMLQAETFRGFRDIRLATLFGGLAAWGLLVPCLALLWLLKGHATLSTILPLAVGSSLASTLLAGWLLFRKVSALPRGGVEGDVRIGNILRAAGPMLIISLTTYGVTQADLWIVGAFRPQGEVALYGAAAKLVLLIAMPLQVVNQVVPPLIAEMYAQGKTGELGRTLRATSTVASIPAFLALAGFLLVGGPILGLVYGDYYREAWTVLALLSLGQLATLWVGSCGVLLTMTGHHRFMMVLSVVSGALMVLAQLAVVGQYGATGVATITFVGTVLLQLLLWASAKKITGIWTHIRFITRAGKERA